MLKLCHKAGIIARKLIVLSVFVSILVLQPLAPTEELPEFRLGKEQARTLMTNHATQIIYAPREQQDANDYSEMLGYTTLRRRQRSTGQEVSHTELEERRALMLPQELKAMGPDKEVLLIEGAGHPALVDKIRYYQEDMFKQRLLAAVQVPSIQGKNADGYKPSNMRVLST